jgi:hypothetical protein
MLSILNGLAFMYAQGQTVYGDPLTSIVFRRAAISIAAGARTADVPVLRRVLRDPGTHGLGAWLAAIGSHEKAVAVRPARRAFVLRRLCGGLLAGFAA